MPDVARDVEGGRPDACTACHADRGAAWAADRMRDFWGARYRRPAARPGGGPLEAPEALASLHAGDPVQRAVYVAALGRPDGGVPAGARGFALANALVGLGDAYGAVRFLARRSALALDRSLDLGIERDLAAYDVQAGRGRSRSGAAGVAAAVRRCRARSPAAAARGRVRHTGLAAGPRSHSPAAGAAAPAT